MKKRLVQIVILESRKFLLTQNLKERTLISSMEIGFLSISLVLRSLKTAD